MPLLKSNFFEYQSNYLSIVVQGAIAADTKLALTSLRKYFPSSEIILSTWEGSDTTGLEFDKVVFCKDPGAISANNEGTLNNLNRQIVSSHEGLKVATRKYALKTRSDIIFKNGNILSELGKFSSRNSKWAFFKHRILTSAVYSRRIFFRRGVKSIALFHPSDIIYVGHTEDVASLFNIPLAEEPNFSRYFENHPEERVEPDPYPENTAKMFPEQYIWHSFVSKHIHAPWKNRLDISNSLHHISTLTLVNNFVFLDIAQCGFSFPKHKIFRQESINPIDLITLYDHFRFRIDYWRYCNSRAFPIPTLTFILSIPSVVIAKLIDIQPSLYLFLRSCWRSLKKFSANR